MCEITILDKIKKKDREENKTREKVFEFLYGCAMVDAIIQKSFDDNEKKWIYDVQEAKECVKVYVNKLFSERAFRDQVEHDRMFLGLAHRICSAINKKKGRGDDFTFGNAQKLLNMTAKHCFIYTFMDLALRDNFKFCHCPMDGIMLKVVWDNYKRIEKDDDKGRRCVLGTSEEFHKSWGKEDFEYGEVPRRYNRFQKTIREWAERVGCIPLELDFYLWDFKKEDKQ